MLNICLFNNFLRKKTDFSKKTVKNCFKDTLDHFLGKRSVLSQKLTKSFLSQIRYRIFYFDNFFNKDCIFREKREKSFSEAKHLLSLTTKMNITFFMGNEILNIFSSNNFFKESHIFRKNCEKKTFEGYNYFLRSGVILRQKWI